MMQWSNFITSELTDSLRTILVLSGYNLSCLVKGFEGGAKLQFCLVKRRHQARMLVLLAAVTVHLFELAEGFDSLEGIGLWEENIGGLEHYSFARCNRNSRLLLGFNFTHTVLIFYARLGAFALRLQLSLLRAALNSLFCDFGLIWRAALNIMGMTCFPALKLFLRALGNLRAHRIDLALGIYLPIVSVS